MSIAVPVSFSSAQIVTQRDAQIAMTKDLQKVEKQYDQLIKIKRREIIDEKKNAIKAINNQFNNAIKSATSPADRKELQDKRKEDMAKVQKEYHDGLNTEIPELVKEKNKKKGEIRESYKVKYGPK